MKNVFCLIVTIVLLFNQQLFAQALPVSFNITTENFYTDYVPGLIVRIVPNDASQELYRGVTDNNGNVVFSFTPRPGALSYDGTISIFDPIGRYDTWVADISYATSDHVQVVNTVARLDFAILRLPNGAVRVPITQKDADAVLETNTTDIWSFQTALVRALSVTPSELPRMSYPFELTLTQSEAQQVLALSVQKIPLSGNLAKKVKQSIRNMAGFKQLKKGR
jgi:hypothetical protein